MGSITKIFKLNFQNKELLLESLKPLSLMNYRNFTYTFTFPISRSKKQREKEDKKIKRVILKKEIDEPFDYKSLKEIISRNFGVFYLFYKDKSGNIIDAYLFPEANGNDFSERIFITNDFSAQRREHRKNFFAKERDKEYNIAWQPVKRILF